MKKLIVLVIALFSIGCCIDDDPVIQYPPHQNGTTTNVVEENISQTSKIHFVL